MHQGHTGSLHERITRSLAYMLRHQPEEFDLDLDPRGYADVADVVCALNEKLGEPIEEADLMDAIESGDRPRYEVADGAIRALYGHSIDIDPGEASEPPELLYVGVGSRDAARAASHGLQSGRRSFLHLALSYEEAQEMGRRIAPEYAVVTVYAREAWMAGVGFYDRKALFLSEPIPTDFMEVGEVHADGVRRDVRGDRRGGARDEDRGRYRRGGSRDEDRGRPRRGGERGRGREPERARPGGRDSRERRDERVPQPAERSVEPERVAERREGGFGSGIFGTDSKEPRRSAAKSEPRREEAAHEPRRTESEPERHESGAQGGFGAGIF